VSRHLAQLLAERAPDGRGVTAGVVVGIVTDNNDRDGLHRVKVRFPWLDDGEQSFWARVASPMAGGDRGLYFLPEVEDEVLVMFEHGDIRFPYIIGALWNGKDKPPVENSDGKNNVRVIKSRSGHVIKLNDEHDKETVEIIDRSGNNSIMIDTAANSITIRAHQDITLAAPNGTITISAQTIALNASGEGTFTTSGKMTVHAKDDLTVKGKTVNIN
jgi:uncharacterized protein involved in type VI secretion and phage assembly